MAVRSREWYIKRVSARIDEIIPDGDNIGGQTAIEDPIETVDDELDDSAHYVLRTAKLALLYPAIRRDKKHFHGTGVNDVDTRLIIDENLKAVVVCPEDFLRFVALKLSSWKRDVKILMDQSDPMYRMQEGNIYTAGNPYKPEGAIISFGEYITILTHGTVIGGPFVVGESLSGNTSNASATIKEVNSGSLILEFTSGSFEASETITGGTSSAFATVSGIVDEYNKWVIAHEFTTNQTVADLDDDDINISEGDIFTLIAQTDEDENGTYLCNASGVAPTQLSNTTSTLNSGTAIECFRANSANETIDKFHYIPRLSIEDLPQDLSDSAIWHCAGRVLEYMGRMNESAEAFRKADMILGNYKLGIKGE